MAGEVGRKRAPPHAVPRLKDDGGGAAFDEPAGGGEARESCPNDYDVEPVHRVVSSHLHLIDIDRFEWRLGSRTPPLSTQPLPQKLLWTSPLIDLVRIVRKPGQEARIYERPEKRK